MNQRSAQPFTRTPAARTSAVAACPRCRAWEVAARRAGSRPAAWPGGAR